VIVLAKRALNPLAAVGLAIAAALFVACEDKPSESTAPTAGTGGVGGAGGATGGGAGSSTTGGSGGSAAGTGGAAGGTAGATTGGSAGIGSGGQATGGAGTGGVAAGNGGSVNAGSGGVVVAGTGGTSGGGAGSGGAGTGGGSTEPGIHFVGRVEGDADSARFAWSGTGVVARFEGTSVAVELGGGQEYTVVIDGTVGPKLTATNGMNTLASGLAAGPHTVELYRRTEAAQGESEFLGFDFGGGTLLAPPTPPARRLEFIGDSITCGYGNEGPDMNCGFTPETENHYLTYAAITARTLEAELSTVAWSGKGVVCNYGDAADSCTNPLPTYYARTLPNDANSAWDFSRFVPDAVVVNLGTNDFSTTSDPSETEFVSGYRAFLEQIRLAYPNAHILCTNGPMLSGTDLTTVRSYLASAVQSMADAKISTFDIEAQDGSDGYGCDWHPSLERHEKVAEVVTAALRSKLGW